MGIVDGTALMTVVGVSSDGALQADLAMDMALLGVAAAIPLASDRLATLLRRIACPVMQPTADVIEGHLRGLEARGLVAIETDSAGRVAIRRTAAGALHLRDMLRMPGPPASSIHHELAFALRVCLLDSLAAEDRIPVVEGLVCARKGALSAADDAVRRCTSPSRSTHRWLARQASRLREDIAWLEQLAQLPASEWSGDGGADSA